jgi:hypothetical protein
LVAALVWLGVVQGGGDKREIGANTVVLPVIFTLLSPACFAALGLVFADWLA